MWSWACGAMAARPRASRLGRIVTIRMVYRVEGDVNPVRDIHRNNKEQY